MNKKIIFIVCTILIALSAFTFAGETGTVLQRYALFVGANNGGRDRVPLLYAATDTKAIAEVFFEVGGLKPENTVISIDPSRRKLEQEFQRIKELIRAKGKESQRSEFFLYYSGHSDEQGLLLNGDSYPYRKLRNEMKDLNADVSIAILDSCASGAFIRTKGGTRVAPFLMDESSSMKGQVYLSSSSEDEASQESDEIGASFFTHSLISALRGAADFSSDGQITIHEAYQYARAETIARTENTLAGTQHPSWHIELTGTGDLVLTDVRELNAGIVLAEDLEGQVFIRDEGEKLVAEVRKAAGMPITLALPAGIYTIIARSGNEGESMESTIALYSGTVLTVSIGDFSAVPQTAHRLRGGDVVAGNTEDRDLGEEIEELVQSYIDEATASLDDIEDIDTEFYKDRAREAASGDRDKEERDANRVNAPFMPASLSFTPGLSVPFRRGNYIVGLSFNILLGTTYGIRGAEFGSIMNITEDTMYGAQFAGVGNIVGNQVTGYQGAGVFNIVDGGLKGAQTAGVFNITEGDNGVFQAAGVFNINAGKFSGVQYGGVFNIASGFRGMQGAGVFNISNRDTHGFQAAGVFNLADQKMEGSQAAGVFNYAGDMDGAQIGTVNVAKQNRGSQIGVVNVAGDISGLQLGVINIADKMNGLPIGLINISSTGLVNFSFTGDLNGFYNLDFQSGNVLYTRLSVGTRFSSLQTEPVLHHAAGLGLHFNLGSFFVEGDAAAATSFRVWGDPQTGYREALPYPEFRAKAGMLFFDRIGGYAGVKATLHVEGMDVNQFGHSGASYEFPVGNRTCTLYHQFIWGVMLEL